MTSINNKSINLLGERLRSLRKLRGLTQSQLSKGICTQGLISNLENGTGKENPSALTVYQLSERLNVSMGYLYGQHTTNEDMSDIRNSEVSNIIQTLKARRDYSTLNYVIKVEKEKKRILTNAEQQYLLWHEAISTYYLDKDLKKAEQLFNSSLELFVEDNTENLVQLIEVELSLGLIYYEESLFEKAETILLNCLTKVEKLGEEVHSKTTTRILFNLAIIYTKMEKYEVSLDFCNRAIDLCKQNESMSFLGDCLYQAGYNYCLLEDFSTGVDYMNKSIVIFQIQENNELIKIVRKNIATMVTKSSSS